MGKGHMYQPVVARRTLLILAAISVCAFANACGGGGNPGGSSNGGGTPPQKTEVVYVGSGNNGSGQILAFTINASGVSTPVSVAAPQYIFDLKADPANAFLYAADFDAGQIAVYSINPSTGALSPAGGSPFSSPLQFGNGGPLVIAPNGKFLFSSDAGGDIVTFTVGSNGMLTPGTGVHDANQPLQLAVDPQSHFLFAANMTDATGDEVSAFSIDPTSGSLNPVTGSPFTFRNNSGPFGIAVHPSGQFLYTALSNASSVAALSINANGALTSISGSPFQTLFIPDGVAIDPAGKFVYVSNKGQGSVSAFTINSTTGGLTEITGSPFLGGDPERIVVDPQGKFLIAVYPNFHQLALYSILSNGTLGSPLTVAAGADPVAVTAIQLQ